MASWVKGVYASEVSLQVVKDFILEHFFWRLKLAQKISIWLIFVRGWYSTKRWFWSQNFEKCSYICWQTSATLELTKPFFLNCQAKKADTLLGFFEKSWEGTSLLNGFSAGNLKLQMVEKLESNRNIRRSGYYSFYEQSFANIWDWRWGDFLEGPHFLVLLVAGRKLSTKHPKKNSDLKLRCIHLCFTWCRDI